MSEDRQLIGRFLEMLAAEAGVARNTLLAYRADLEAASSFLEGGLATAKHDALERVAQHWSPLARASVARKSAALRRFYGFLEDEKLRLDNPSSALPRVSARRSLPKILNHDDIRRLFEAITAGGESSAKAIRMQALLELLYGSGLRATELVSLGARAISPDRPFLILKGSTKKTCI